MANLLEDIQSVGSDTRPPMLDRFDFATWQQRICLYCMGKDNGANIIKSIDEGPFKIGKFRETLAEGEEGALHLGPEQDRVFVDLSPEKKDRVVVQNVQGRQNRGQWNYARGAVAAGNEGVQNRVGNANPGQGRLNEEQVQDLALNKDNVFQADQCDSFDSDVDEAPTAQTMFMANLSSVDPIYDEAGSSYDSDILSEVQDHDNYQDVVCEHHEAHEMHNDVQPNYVVDSDVEYTSDSNMIPYDQFVKDNEEQVVQSNVSSLPNDAYMMIINEMHEQATQCVSANE
ncbi:hypothetical protein Tco_0941718 [Tanacetum coccineum]|uniref:Integrase, catalytic region, zinc finger, CCHC-type, peptidase aspartic, catalytic n=1 Tax=Tanacetum coccineum TaxID=301880 RepID=A0ABQ5DT96_9ASTR